MSDDGSQTASRGSSGAAGAAIRSLRRVGPGALLEGASLVYVALPFVIFALGWLRLWIAIPVAAVCAVAVWRALAGATRIERSPLLAGRREWIALGGLLAVVGFLVLYSGAGGYAHQYDDYRRHNALVRDLIELPWPLFYPRSPLGGQPGWLAFYIANGLPASLVGRALGWTAASHAVFLWTAGGFFLAVCWFLRVIGRVSFRYGLLFIFFGGVDIVGRVLLLGWYVDGTQMLSNWVVRYAVASTPQAAALMQGVFWFYPSNLNFIYYAPQHVLGPWLCVLMILYDAIHRGTARRSVFLWSLVLLWSAFSFVGLLPFVALAALASRRRGLWSFENTVAAGLVLLVTVLYIGSNNQEYPHGFLWQKQNVLSTWPTLLLVYAVEFGLYAWLCPRVERAGMPRLHRGWWWLCLAMLVAAPWYVLGTFNDLTTKSVIPALIVLQVWIATAMLSARSDEARRRVRVLVAVLVIGSLASVADLVRGLDKGLSEPVPVSRVMRMNEVGPGAGQLFSDGDAPFWRWLARSPAPRR